jgi:hypothetical protein
MFFIRSTLLLGLGVLVLPTDEASQARVASGARTAVHWTVTFCDRNADTCVKGREAWAVFVKKAEFGAKMAYDIMTERKTLASGPSQPAPFTVTEGAPRQRSTLKSSDLEPAWRGKVARAGG